MAVQDVAVERGYVEIEGRWRHVYIVESFEQVDIFGDKIEILVVKLTKSSKQTYEVERSKIKDHKPKPVKEIG